MILGVDVGGSKIAAGLVSVSDGTVESFRQVPTGPERGGAAIFADVEELADQLSASRPVRAIGISICELVSQEGQLLTQATIPWTGREVRERLCRIAPVFFEADVRAAARAEARFGAGSGSPAFLYVTIGTGISCALVLQGQPYEGIRGAAGTLASGPMPCFLPSIEAQSSGVALARRYGIASAKDVFDRAEAGDARALEVLVEGGRTLGAALGWLVNVLDPECVVLGGGIGLRPGVYRKAVMEAARAHIWWPGHRDVRFVSAQTGPAAGVIGAALAAAARLRET